MSAKAMSFSGVAPEPNPAPDRGASAFYGERRSAITPSRGLRPAHTVILYRRAFVCTGELGMARRELTVQRHEEIKRRLADGRSVREIASALNCSRRLVRQIRDGVRVTHAIAASPDPLWMSQLEWPVIIHDLGLGHPLKFIWEEKAQSLTTYSNFWKHYLRGILIYRRLADLLILGSFGLPLVHIKRTRSRRPECQK